MKELYTTAELSKVLKLTEKTIYNMRLDGMPYKQIGRAIRFDPVEVIKWIEDKQNNNERC